MKREDLTEKILDLKRDRNWSWKHITNEIAVALRYHLDSHAPLSVVRVFGT